MVLASQGPFVIPPKRTPLATLSAIFEVREVRRQMSRTSADHLNLRGKSHSAAKPGVVRTAEMGPQRESAEAAHSDTYQQLNLFGEVFERVRADYVEKPDDSKLVDQWHARWSGPTFELHGSK